MRTSTFFKLALGLFLFFAPVFAWAGTEHNLSGYAWSSNIGWVSFNCTNTGTCGTSNYGVNRNSDGTLVGYAWSSNIGWVQFGGLSGFPVGNGTQSINAQVNGNNLQGWARALSYGGGWDGWIALSGSYGAGSYGVNINDGIHFTGYAWGGDVVGWVSFDVAGANGVQIAGDATLSSTAVGTVEYNTNATLSWTFVNAPSISCGLSKTSSGGTPFTTINNITNATTPQNVSTGPLTNASYTYQLSCTNPSVTKQVSFIVAAQQPAFTLGATEYAKIQFLAAGAAESETENIYVYPNAAFAAAGNPVSVSITTYPTPPAGTTFTYSLGGGAFSATPPAVQITSPYNAAQTLRVRVSKPITSQYVIRLTGTSGAASATKDIVLDPVGFDPKFQEI